MNMMTVSDIYHILTIIALVATAIVYIFSSARKNDIKVLRSSNDDLTKALDIKTKQIEDLKCQVDTLSIRVNVLEKTNSDLVGIVKQALIEYFESNPKIVEKLNKMV